MVTFYTAWPPLEITSEQFDSSIGTLDFYRNRQFLLFFDIIF